MARPALLDVRGARELEQLAREIAVLEADAKELKPAFREIAANLRRAIGREQFETKGAARGRRWRRRARSGPGTLLERSGDLRASFEDETDRHHVEEISDSELRWGSSHPLAPLHQHSGGGERVTKSGRRTGKLPKREIARLRRRDVDELVTEVVARRVFRSLR